MDVSIQQKKQDKEQQIMHHMQTEHGVFEENAYKREELFNKKLYKSTDINWYEMQVSTRKLSELLQINPGSDYEALQNHISQIVLCYDKIIAHGNNYLNARKRKKNSKVSLVQSILQRTEYERQHIHYVVERLGVENYFNDPDKNIWSALTELRDDDTIDMTDSGYEFRAWNKDEAGLTALSRFATLTGNTGLFKERHIVRKSEDINVKGTANLAIALKEVPDYRTMADIEQESITNEHNIVYSPAALQQLQLLKIYDLIVGIKTRTQNDILAKTHIHDGNTIVIDGVMGGDVSGTFVSDIQDSDIKFDARMIDAEAYSKIINISSENLQYMLGDVLSKETMDKCIHRLDVIKKKIYKNKIALQRGDVLYRNLYKQSRFEGSNYDSESARLNVRIEKLAENLIDTKLTKEQKNSLTKEQKKSLTEKEKKILIEEQKKTLTKEQRDEFRKQAKEIIESSGDGVKENIDYIKRKYCNAWRLETSNQANAPKANPIAPETIELLKFREAYKRKNTHEKYEAGSNEQKGKLVFTEKEYKSGRFHNYVRGSSVGNISDKEAIYLSNTLTKSAEKTKATIKASEGVHVKYNIVDHAQDPLFEHMPSPMDVKQHNVGDCYFLAALASVAASNPEMIQNNMKDNSDGTVIVRMYDRTEQHNAHYIRITKRTIDTDTTNVDKYMLGKSKQSNLGAYGVLWVKLYEKAYSILRPILDAKPIDKNKNTINNENLFTAASGSGNKAYEMIVGAGDRYSVSNQEDKVRGRLNDYFLKFGKESSQKKRIKKATEFFSNGCSEKEDRERLMANNLDKLTVGVLDNISVDNILIESRLQNAEEKDFARILSGKIRENLFYELDKLDKETDDHLYIDSYTETIENLLNWSTVDKTELLLTANMYRISNEGIARILKVMSQNVQKYLKERCGDLLSFKGQKVCKNLQEAQGKTFEYTDAAVLHYKMLEKMLKNKNKTYSVSTKAHKKSEINGLNGESGRGGIYYNHEYTLLSVSMIGNQRVIAMRNPWGHSVPCFKNVEDKDGKIHTIMVAFTKTDTDGVFYLDFNEFMSTYDYISEGNV